MVVPEKAQARIGTFGIFFELEPAPGLIPVSVSEPAQDPENDYT